MQTPEQTSRDKITSLHLESTEGDDNAKVLGYVAPQSFTREDERRFVRKLDHTILPCIMIMYMLSYLDRGNIGNARKIGLAEDLSLSSSQYNWASAAFYCGTIPFGPIGGLMLKVVNPSVWLAVCLVGWGALAAIQAATTNAAGITVVRFFLGVFEASFAPGCALYISFWYLKSELALRIAAYAGTSALSGIVGSLIAYGFGSAKNSLAIKPWQALFITEGVPTIAFGLITYFILPGRPESGRSWWFTEAEHAIALDRRNKFTSQSEDKGINFGHIKEALLDYRLYIFTVVYSGLSLSLAVLSVFLPTLVATFGYTGAEANAFVAPIYGAAYVILLITAWLSDRYSMRGLPIAVGGCIAGVGYLLLLCITNSHARYGCAFLTAIGTYMAFPLVLAWISSTFAADTKSGISIGIVIAVTHGVGIAASNIYPTGEEPQYATGNAVSSALTFATTLGSGLMVLLLRRENRRRDRRYGKPEDGAVVYLADAADKSPSFRYML